MALPVCLTRQRSMKFAKHVRAALLLHRSVLLLPLMRELSVLCQFIVAFKLCICFLIGAGCRHSSLCGASASCSL